MRQNERTPRNASDRTAAVVLGALFAVTAYAYLGWWNNDVAVFDPKPNNAVLPHFLAPLSRAIGPVWASLMGGIAVGGLTYWVAPWLSPEAGAD